MESSTQTYQTLVPENDTVPKRRGISGSTLKIIAITTMLIDHIGAAILERLLIQRGLLGVNMNDMTSAMAFYEQNGVLLLLDSGLRMIGRVSFPIFCFLLVEGFMHTRDVKKYAVRLLAFCFLSEIPFDLAFHGKLLDMQFQNVFFTLFIGLLVLISFRYIESREMWSKPVKVLLALACLGAGMYVAQILRTDYFAFGVAAIVLLYVLRKHKALQIIGGCLTFLWEITAPLAFIPIGFYNGKRGISLKYAFYAFYPVHMLILYFIARLLGIE